MSKKAALWFLAMVVPLFMLSGCIGTASQLTKAASNGDDLAVEQYLAEGREVDAKDWDGATSLYYAALSGHIAVLQRLLEAGADPDALNLKYKKTALRAAVDGDSVDAVALLLREGADPNIPDKNGKTPFHISVEGFKLKLAEMLLANGADVNLRAESYTPLMMAARAKNTDMVKLLLAEGADATLLSEGDRLKNLNALFFAVDGLVRVNDVPLSFPEDLDGFPSSMSQITAEEFSDKKLKMIEWLALAGAEVSGTGGMFPPLHMTVTDNENLKVSEKLLLLGADPNEKGSNDQTALYWAASKGNAEQVALLLAFGAEVNVKNRDELRTALHIAAQNGYTKVVDILLAAGADANQRGGIGYTPFYLASYGGHVDVIKSMIAAGVDLDTKNDNSGWTALATAAEKNHSDVVKQLLAAGADVNVRSHDGSTALYLTAKANKLNDDIIKMLLAAGADPNIPTYKGDYPLHYAAYLGYYDTVKLLLQGGADPNIVDKDDETALDIAKRQEFSKTTAYIQQYGGRTYSYRAQSSSSGGNLFGQIFSTVAIAGIAVGADIPIENTIDVMGAAVNDIWVEDGHGSQLAQMNQSLMEGTYEIKDPALRELAQTRVQMNNQNEQLQQQIAHIQAQQKLEQESQQRLVAERQVQQEQQRLVYLQQRQEMMKEQQQRAQKISDARLFTEQERRTRLVERQQVLLTQSTSSEEEVDSASLVSVPPNLPKIQPKETNGSKVLANLNISESKEVECDCEGTITKQNLQVGSCKIESMTLAYDISAFMGEPVVRGDYKWTAPNDGETDCLPSGLTLWLKMQNSSSYGYIGTSPVVPKAGGVSYSGTASSPNWDSFICSYSGAEEVSCFDAATAKNILKKGRIVDFHLSHQ